MKKVCKVRVSVYRIYSHIAEEHLIPHSATFVPVEELVILLYEFRNL